MHVYVFVGGERKRAAERESSREREGGVQLKSFVPLGMC